MPATAKTHVVDTDNEPITKRRTDLSIISIKEIVPNDRHTITATIPTNNNKIATMCFTIFIL